jgi:hypothetical protein
MKLNKLAFATLLAIGCSAASADTAPGWIDWTSNTTGTLQIGSTTVGVTLSGSTPNSVESGTYYYNNGNTGGNSPTGTYGGLAPSGLVRVSDVSAFTLTFSQAIVNPYVAFVSVGQAGAPVTYTFNAPISSVVSSGSNYWGYTGYSTTANSFTGREYNGVIQLSGTYNQLTVAVGQPEDWHSFNVGSSAVAAVPEPETYAMLLAGLGLMGGIARRRSQAK